MGVVTRRPGVHGRVAARWLVMVIAGSMCLLSACAPDHLSGHSSATLMAWVSAVAPTNDPVVYEAQVDGAEPCDVSIGVEERTTTIVLSVVVGECEPATGTPEPGVGVGKSRWVSFRLGGEVAGRVFVSPDPEDPHVEITPRVELSPRQR